MLGCFCQFCAQPQATTIEENLSVSCTEVAISDNSLPCQQSDSKVEESEPAVSVTTTAGEIGGKIRVKNKQWIAGNKQRRRTWKYEN